MSPYRKLLVAALALGLAGALAAGELPKLPADRALPQSGDSPGVVTFSHRAHVPAEAPDCTACHPRPWPMLSRSEDATPVTHERMEAGEQCGACHGRTAFAFDDCAACHR